MKRFFAAGIAAALASFAGQSVAQADQVPAWWIVQQQMVQQQIQQSQASRQQISQAMQRQLDTQSITLQAQASALEAQRDLNALQLRNELDRELEDMRNIQQNQLLQILQMEVSPAPHKKAVQKKRHSL